MWLVSQKTAFAEKEAWNQEQADIASLKYTQKNIHKLLDNELKQITYKSLIITEHLLINKNIKKTIFPKSKIIWKHLLINIS